MSEGLKAKNKMYVIYNPSSTFALVGDFGGLRID